MGRLQHKVTVSVTRWLDYLSIFDHSQQYKFAWEHKIFAREGSKFCQTLNKPFKNCLRLLKFWQSGEISPNLVTVNVEMDSSIARIQVLGTQCSYSVVPWRGLTLTFGDGSIVTLESSKWFQWCLNLYRLKKMFASRGLLPTNYTHPSNAEDGKNFKTIFRYDRARKD